MSINRYYSGDALLRLPLNFDIEQLQADLSRCEAASYHDHYNQVDYQGSWKILSLRSINGDPANPFGGFDGRETYQDTPLLERTPYFRSVLDVLECELQSVRLMNLCAGSQIHTHTDSFLGYEDGQFRLHIPIRTHKEVAFVVDGQRADMKPGEVWYGNFNQPHSVHNRSPIDRIHLVIDCVRNTWSDTLFARAGYNFEAEQTRPELDAHTRARIVEELQRNGLPIPVDLIHHL